MAETSRYPRTPQPVSAELKARGANRSTKVAGEIAPCAVDSTLICHSGKLKVLPEQPELPVLDVGQKVVKSADDSDEGDIEDDSDGPEPQEVEVCFIPDRLHRASAIVA
jgi:hypothetical protein